MYWKLPFIESQGILWFAQTHSSMGMCSQRTSNGLLQAELIGLGPIPEVRCELRVWTEKNVVNSVFCCFLGTANKSLQNQGLLEQFSVTLRGQLHWTGPIANTSDSGVFKRLMTQMLLQLVIHLAGGYHTDGWCMFVSQQ